MSVERQWVLLSDKYPIPEPKEGQELIVDHFGEFEGRRRFETDTIRGEVRWEDSILYRRYKALEMTHTWKGSEVYWFLVPAIDCLIQKPRS